MHGTCDIQEAQGHKLRPSQVIHAKETGSSQNWNFQIAAEPIEEYIPTIPSHYQTHFLLPSTSLTLTVTLILTLNLNLNLDLDLDLDLNLNLKYSFEWSAKSWGGFTMKGLFEAGDWTWNLRTGGRHLATVPTSPPSTPNIILLRYGNRNLVVAGNGGNIFSNGLSGDLEISNSGMSAFPLR